MTILNTILSYSVRDRANGLVRGAQSSVDGVICLLILTHSYHQMRQMRLLVLLMITFLLADGYMDWCEYWARMGKKESHPECAGYQLPKRAQLSPEKKRPVMKGLPRCDAKEMLGCSECEARCDRDTTDCGKKRCTRRSCICRGNLFRDSLGNCVPSCPVNSTGLLTTVQKMVPILLKDMWRSVFRAFRSSTPLAASSNSTLS